MAWAKNGTYTETTTVTTITLTPLTARKFNVILDHTIGNSYQNLQRLNGDSGNNYVMRISSNGGADTTSLNETHLGINWGDTTDGKFIIIYICSISGQEKLTIGFGVKTNTAGAGTAPQRAEQVGKYIPSPDAGITSYSTYNGLGSYTAGSNISAIGTD